jgi:NAD(P)-dependent dehydrogenase (short-subunit alcohol dehydrogenase family)
MKPPYFAGKTVLVTGAAHGIGRATALAFAHAGADLIISDIDESALAETDDEIRGVGCQVMARQVDVSDRESMRAFAEEVHSDREAVDVLVNNAGVAIGGGFLETALDDWDWLLGPNLYGVIHGCHFFVPPMVVRDRGGHVVNMSSAAGIMAQPLLAAYSATKFAIYGLSEALREEVRSHGIVVTAVCPGLINTRIAEHGRMRGRVADPEIRERVYEMYRTCRSGPDDVARAIVSGVRRRRAVVKVAREGWAFAAARRLCPAVAPRLFKGVFDRMLGLD